MKRKKKFVRSENHRQKIEASIVRIIKRLRGWDSRAMQDDLEAFPEAHEADLSFIRKEILKAAVAL